MGFDNLSKRELFKAKALEVVGALQRFAGKIESLKEQETQQTKELLSCQTLANLSWSEVDVVSVLERITSLQERIAAETSARPDLAEIDVQIERQSTAVEEAVSRKGDAEAAARGLENDINGAEQERTSLRGELLAIRLTPFQVSGLEERLGTIGKRITLANLDRSVSMAERAIREEKADIDRNLERLKNSIENRFASFNRSWPAESDGLDAKLESADDYFAKLDRLVRDNLPKFEQRFLQLLPD